MTYRKFYAGKFEFSKGALHSVYCTERELHSGFLYKIWSDADLNLVFEICGTGLQVLATRMLVGPNLASIP